MILGIICFDIHSKFATQMTNKNVMFAHAMLADSADSFMLDDNWFAILIINASFFYKKYRAC